MVARLADELENIDFHQRSRHMLILSPILYCSAAFLAVVFTGFIIGDIHSKLLFVLVMAIIMSGLGILFILFAGQTRDLVMVTEFQNAILASAVQMNMRFCLIVEHTGTIAYMDRGFQKFFSHSSHTNIRNIQGVFSSIGATAETENAITEAIVNSRSERILATLKDAEGQSFPMMIMVDVLPRPKGFFLIRGRDYITKRKIFSAESESASAMMLSRVLDTLPEGALVTRANGGIVYANRILEEWLGFAIGELPALSISLQHIVYQYGAEKVGRIIMDDYTGDITLQRKDRTLLRLYVQQMSMHEDNVKMGVSATFRLIKE